MNRYHVLRFWKPCVLHIKDNAFKTLQSKNVLYPSLSYNAEASLDSINNPASEAKHNQILGP